MINVEDFIDQIENPRQKALFINCHRLITGIAPGVEGKIKYKIPFYCIRKDFCYLNPYKDYLYIGFPRGAHLAKRESLQREGKKTIARLFIPDLNYLLSDEVKEIVLESILIDQELYSKK